MLLSENDQRESVAENKDQIPTTALREHAGTNTLGNQNCVEKIMCCCYPGFKLCAIFVNRQNWLALAVLINYHELSWVKRQRIKYLIQINDPAI